MSYSSVTIFRRCNKCGVEYPRTVQFFHRANKGPGRVDYRCRLCQASPKRRHRVLAKVFCPPGYQACAICLEYKPATPEHFSRTPAFATGLSNRCKPCGNRIVREYQKKRYAADPHWRGTPREGHLRTRYGIGEADYRKLYEEQGGRCVLCSKQGRLVVDHCHTTGHIRGLLCMNCNSAIGQLGDDPVRLREAAEYIEDRGNL